MTNILVGVLIVIAVLTLCGGVWFLFFSKGQEGSEEKNKKSKRERPTKPARIPSERKVKPPKPPKPEKPVKPQQKPDSKVLNPSKDADLKTDERQVLVVQNSNYLPEVVVHVWKPQVSGKGGLYKKVEKGKPNHNGVNQIIPTNPTIITEPTQQVSSSANNSSSTVNYQTENSQLLDDHDLSIDKQNTEEVVDTSIDNSNISNNSSVPYVINVQIQEENETATTEEVIYVAEDQIDADTNLLPPVGSAEPTVSTPITVYSEDINQEGYIGDVVEIPVLEDSVSKDSVENTDTNTLANNNTYGTTLTPQFSPNVESTKDEDKETYLVEEPSIITDPHYGDTNPEVDTGFLEWPNGDFYSEADKTKKEDEVKPTAPITIPEIESDKEYNVHMADGFDELEISAEEALGTTREASARAKEKEKKAQEYTKSAREAARASEKAAKAAAHQLATSTKRAEVEAKAAAAAVKPDRSSQRLAKRLQREQERLAKQEEKAITASKQAAAAARVAEQAEQARIAAEKAPVWEVNAIERQMEAEALNAAAASIAKPTVVTFKNEAKPSQVDPLVAFLSGQGTTIPTSAIEETTEEDLDEVRLEPTFTTYDDVPVEHDLNVITNAKVPIGPDPRKYGLPEDLPPQLLHAAEN